MSDHLELLQDQVRRLGGVRPGMPNGNGYPRAERLHPAIVSQSSHTIILGFQTTAIHESQWQPSQPEPPQY